MAPFNISGPYPSRRRRYFLEYVQDVLKKRPNVCYKDFILQHFKHCPLQSSPLYWRYTVSNVSSWKALSVMARSSLIAFS